MMGFLDSLKDVVSGAVDRNLAKMDREYKNYEYKGREMSKSSNSNTARKGREMQERAQRSRDIINKYR